MACFVGTIPVLHQLRPESGRGESGNDPLGARLPRVLYSSHQVTHGIRFELLIPPSVSISLRPGRIEAGFNATVRLASSNQLPVMSSLLVELGGHRSKHRSRCRNATRRLGPGLSRPGLGDGEIRRTRLAAGTKEPFWVLHGALGRERKKESKLKSKQKKEIDPPSEEVLHMKP